MQATTCPTWLRASSQRNLEGPKISAGERDRLSQPLARTSVSGTGGKKSTGLGLAVVRKIVLGHAGEIWVESEAGWGTTFYASLPAHREEDGM